MPPALSRAPALPVLLSRPDCHLCEVLGAALVARGVRFDTVIVDHHPAWRARFGEIIPVLLDPATDEPVQETFFDEGRLAAWQGRRG